MKQYGILGGTFDPPHHAHFEIAIRAIEQFSLAKVVFIPAGNPWHKEGNISTYEHRYKMTQLLISSSDYLEVSDLESDISKPTYTIDTLRKIPETDNNYFIIGADVAREFTTWKDYNEIFNHTKILVAPRNGVSSGDLDAIFPGPYNLIQGDEVDLSKLPIQTCWPGDAGPLVTWPLVITRGPNKQRQNLGIYRQQVIGKNRLIMRWLSHRGGALDFRDWQLQHPGENFPVAVALGADPATILGAVTPVPDTLSEYAFAGLLRGGKTEVASCLTCDLQVPASAEYILEGHISPDDMADEGPFGDHTGYYNEVDRFPVFTVTRITHRQDPIYHSTYTGRPPDEPAVLGVALNEVFVPILQKQFPEIVDFYLPPEGCSYRMAVVTIKKQYPGHAKRVMMGVWSFLRQFMYTKFVIVTDDDVNARDWNDVIWAMTTRMDPARDTTLISNTPIDYLDFASPVSGLGSKMGMDATNKWPGETDREWGEPIAMDPSVKQRVDELWHELGID